MIRNPFDPQDSLASTDHFTLDFALEVVKAEFGA
jgi:hypothetical protein